MRIADHIVVETVDDQSVLLDLNRNTYFALNRVGKMVIQGITDGLSKDDIQNSVCECFPAQPRERIADDVAAFLAHLESQEMLIVS